MPVENGTDERTSLTVDTDDGFAAALAAGQPPVAADDLERGVWAVPEGYEALIGQPLDELLTGAPFAGTGVIEPSGAFDAVDPAGTVPGYVIGHLGGATGLPPDPHVALVVNGKVAAVAAAVPWGGEPAFFAALVPDRYLVDGTNEVELYVLEGPGDPAAVTLHPLAG
jgi:hypothetical protein